MKGRELQKITRRLVSGIILPQNRGDADAQYKLGLMYSNGEGISQDNKEATKWFQLAVEQGNTLAQEKLDEILNKNNLWKKIKDIF